MGTDSGIPGWTGRRWLIVLVSVSVLLVVLATVFLFVLVANEFSVAVTLNGGEVVTVEYGETYAEPGAEAVLRGSRALTAGIPVEVQVRGRVDDFRLGEYELVYTASMGPWTGIARRTVRVVDTAAPSITLFSNDAYLVKPGQSYREEGYLALDNYDGDITDLVEVSEGDGIVIYTVTDSSGNTASVIRQIRYAGSE